jgi:uncharacterized protein YgbK (DUF1537 family)
MSRLRILADDLTGALDCAAAFGAGVTVRLGRPAEGRAVQEAIETVATATRDVPVALLPELLSPSVAWLRGGDVAFKKVDSLLRGNTFDEVDWLARQAPAQRLVMVPAFPAQQRVTEGGQQWWRQADGSRSPVAASIQDSLQARGWRVDTGALPPAESGDSAQPQAWVPDVLNDADLDRIAHLAQQSGTRWLWCGSAGLAHALARQRSASALGHKPDLDNSRQQGTAPHGQTLLISASHHPVSREQWRVLRAARSAQCLHAQDPRALERAAPHYPSLIDLSATERISPQQASALLQAQALAIAAHAPRPRTLVVVGGDTLLALCQALGASTLRSEQALDRPGWGCARLVGGHWDGLVCHTRSGAFGGPQDLLEVIEAV